MDANGFRGFDCCTNLSFHYIYRYCFFAEFATEDDQQWIINDHSGSELKLDNPQWQCQWKK